MQTVDAMLKEDSETIELLIKENDQLQAEIERLLKELQQTKERALFYKTILDQIKNERTEV
jgi:hypothetical protein